MSIIKLFDSFRESDLGLLLPNNLIDEIGIKLFQFFKPNTDMTNIQLEDISKWITSLDLYYNKVITVLNPSIFYNLTSLRINRKSTNDIITGLTNLKYLQLEDNQIITDDGISNLKNLTLLSLGNSSIITDEGISKLENLKSLNLSYMCGNLITDNGISNLVNLTSIDLS